MSMQSTGHGFTIIEVMLVLAVTGLMLIGVFVGANAQISTQRYHDSVTSLQSDLQNEYSQALNVANDRPKGTKCTFTSEPDSSRGADSTCLILGRLIQGKDDTITSSPVIGTNTAGHQPNDPLTPANWKLLPAPTSDNSDTYALKWGSTMKAKQATSYGTQFSALVVVSPANGTIQTYVNTTTANQTAQQLFTSGAIQELNLCVTNSSNIFTGSLLAVRIDAGASGIDSVEVPVQSDNVCQGAS